MYKRAAVMVLAALALRSYAQTYDDNLPIDHDSIRYLSGAADDPVTRLSRKLERGEVRLGYHDNGLGYLPSLLEQLGVRADSQALVFSKTSLQAAKISPRNPRAIYFADDIAVGFVRGGDTIELAALDAHQGVHFYTLGAQPAEHPQLMRQEICLQCHDGPATAGVPGIFVSSVYPNIPVSSPRRTSSFTRHMSGLRGLQSTEPMLRHDPFVLR